MRKKIFLTVIVALACMTCMVSTAMAHNGVVGFVNYSDGSQFGVTGGAGGKVVHVATREDFVKYVSGSTPYIIVLDADIIGGGMQDLQDEVSLGSNKTVVGSGSGKALKGICLDAKGQGNIIFRNITLTKGRTDGMSFRGCHHVWVDHCDLSDSYDGLLDFTLASDYLTVSWTKIHNHDKVSIVNSGTCHFEDYGKEHATYAHCWFADNVQRNPRIGYGKAHVYNCYWTNISSYCIGVHSQGEVLSEYNYFASTANKAFNNQYTTTLPYCGFITDVDSYFGGSNPKKASDQPYTDITYTPKTYYEYAFDQTDALSVPTEIEGGVGPKDGLAYEPILNPGNGAIEVPVDMKLTWHSALGTNQGKVLFGTNKESLDEIDRNSLSLLSGTTYYWKVVVEVDGKEVTSPVYQFTTAAAVATNPYPTDGDVDPWLRWPSSQYAFCTAMPLTWRQAFDAKSYKVYLAESADRIDDNLIGETSKLSIVPQNLALGKTYYWRVDAVKNDGGVERGTVWTFSTPEHNLVVGKNEAEKMYLSGIAFTESATRTYSGSKVTVGDQGPGSLVGTWSGAEGRYAITVAYRSETVGISTYGVSINGKLVDKWYSGTDKDGVATRKVRHTQLLKPGDEIRLEFIAGPKAEGEISEARARLDYIKFDANENEVVDVTRASSTPHSPNLTVGYECEYLRMPVTLFRDSLGNVGDYDSYQVSDDYCSWISYLTDNAEAGVKVDAQKNPVVTADKKLVYYIKEAELVKFFAATSGNIKAVIKLYGETGEADSIAGADSLTLNLDKAKQYRIELSAVDSEIAISRAELYKVAPVPFIYHTPVPSEGKEYEFIWSTDIVFMDTYGTKGAAGKVQISSGFDEWCQYYNPTANEVQAKNSSNAVYYLDPMTDKACSRKFVPGGSGYCYVVGTAKSMTYFLQNCSKVKIYYTGSGGAAKALHLEVKDVTTGTETMAQGGEATGKSVASNCVETELNASHKYKVKVIADSDGGDMLVYATKLWYQAPKMLGDANDDGTIDVADITAIAAYILGQETSQWNATNADANEDGNIDVADITAVASIILGFRENP